MALHADPATTDTPINIITFKETVILPVEEFDVSFEESMPLGGGIHLKFELHILSKILKRNN